MRKVIVDTNVLVSALIQRSFPNLILQKILTDDRIILCLSKDLLQEYHAVLNRNKFRKYTAFLIQAEKTLVVVEQKAKLFVPDQTIIIMKDKGDNKLLELANKSKANYLITGNSNDFHFKKFNKTKIVSPRKYWELFHENQ